MGSAKYILASFMALSVLPSGISAKCSHDIAERGLAEYQAKQALQAAGLLNKRQSMTEATEAALTDPGEECTPYTISGLDTIIHEQFPPLWQIAEIVDGDDEATALLDSIVNATGFPNYAPKGTPAGNFTGVVYNYTDPECWWTWNKCTTPKVDNLPDDITTCAEPHTWGLSFDDGPNCTHNQLYDFWAQQDVTATVMYIGSSVAIWPLQAQRAIKDGHQVGVHTWSHRYATALTNEQFFAELYYTKKIIKLVLGVTPTFWRPPYGDVDDRIRAIARGLNLTTTMWSHDTDDWKIVNPTNPNGLPTASVVANYDAVYADNAAGQFNSEGAIVLCHELNNATMSLGIAQFPNIAANFEHIVPVATCLNVSHPYVETNVSFPTFAEYLATNSSRMIVGSDTSETSSSAAPTSTAGIANAAAAKSVPSDGANTSGSVSSLRMSCIGSVLVGAVAACIAL